MMTRYLCLAAGLVLLAAPARAQSADIAGVRARGFGGAFTAVADDASATWWNPAGLAGGALFGAVVEYDHADEPYDAAFGPATPPSQVAALAVAVPALGISYYHFRISEIRRLRATGGGAPSRQDLGPAGEGVLVANQFGATVGQSLGDHFVLATTLKLLHGGPEGGASTTAATLDAGAMATFGPARIGIAVRNATEPSLGRDPSFTVAREVRAGAAVVLDTRGPVDAITLAADADLATRPLVTGDEREIAAGAEMWIAARRIGIRGGFSGETVGDFRPSGSAGASIAVRPGAYLEVAGTAGGTSARRGWSAALRVTF